MIKASIAFLAGIIVLHQCDVLPDYGWITGLLLTIGLLLRFTKLRIPVWLLAGFVWAWVQAWVFYQHDLPAQFEGQDMLITGEVVSVPHRQKRSSSFLFHPIEAKNVAGRWQNPGVIKLSWYGRHPTLEPGQIWQLKVRLKKPNGLMNPAGFDYESWLFRKGISALGYVRKDVANKLQNTVFNLQHIRYDLLHSLRKGIGESKAAGVLIALALGIRSDIEPEQWQVFQKTGTSHLVAISGLHIGLVASLCFFLGRWIWSRLPGLCLFFPAPRAAAIFAMSGALVYALLAGMAIPTQRALSMVVVVMLSILLNRNSRPSHTLSLALLVVLILDTRSVLSAGFWLSFSAVAVLIYGLSNRVHALNGWKSSLKAQWLITIGLFPLTLFFFQSSSLISPLANIIAIPWVSLLIVPGVLIASLMILSGFPGAESLLQLTGHILEPLQYLLAEMAHISFSQWFAASPSIIAILVSIIGIVLLLSPAGIPVKRLGAILLLPVFFQTNEMLPTGSIKLTLLDAGQGLASVVQTQNHTLVFDTGAIYSERFDIGRAVVVPYLRQQGIQMLDMVVISHGDRDHIGGFHSVRQAFPIKTLYSGSPERLTGNPVMACKAGISWRWDGVDFSFIHPVDTARLKRNDRSCVLKISSDAGSILLTGDIHRKSERILVRQKELDLSADILVAPHHGSKSSSMMRFIERIKPRYVLFASGYRNRFRHPNPMVVKRYQQVKSEVLSSPEEGAIQFTLIPGQTLQVPRRYRKQHAHHWSRQHR